MSGFSEGAGPGGQTGRCLFGIGIGHAADVLMLSRLSVGVNGCGEDDRVCPEGMGLGRAIVAISSASCSWCKSSKLSAMYLGAACKELRGRRSYPNGEVARNGTGLPRWEGSRLKDKK